MELMQFAKCACKWMWLLWWLLAGNRFLRFATDRDSRLDSLTKGRIS
jgi:hypothetical protein